MDDRYEIRGKIGQGGIGAVYRAYDKNLSREVAIKRILPEGGADLEKEATRQLTKEAGALSALQHPHIVTIYDVGIDEDGPYVVMELLHGKTVDEVVEKASFTWQDFREFAMQTQEALIAAQDMSLVHRDLKPTNVMLTWLPSGKFQVKVVDFGLAKFSPKPSLQTIDQKDSIFGSIFFMSPEQFERTELDMRTDMYSIGCVYYYALTGVHPFNGETGPQVMVAHLDHRVFPLHEIRPDMPRWVCDWVMWHINRLPDHRPKNAREALGLFIQSDLNAGPHTFQAEAASAAKPKLVTPGSPVAQTSPSATNPAIAALIKTAPQPILPPEGFGRPSVHTGSQPKIQDNGEFVPAPNAPAPAAIVTPTAAPTPIEPAAPAPAPDLSDILKTTEPSVVAEEPAKEEPAIVAPSEPATPAAAVVVPIPVTALPEDDVPATISPSATPLPNESSVVPPAATSPTESPAKPILAMSDESAPKPKPRLIIPGAKPAPAAAPEPTPAPAAIPVAAPVTPEAPALTPEAPAITPEAPPVIPPAVPVAAPVVPAVPVVPAAPPVVPAAPPVVPVVPAAVPVVPAVAAAAPALVAKPALQTGPTPIAVARPIATASPAPGTPQTVPLQAHAPTGPAIKPPANAPGAQLSVTGPAKSKGMSNGAKAALATTIGLIVIVLAAVMLSRGAEGKINKRYNELVSLAAMSNTKELPVTAKDLDILLNAATSLTASNSRETVYKSLYIAQSTDGTDVDAVLAEYTTKTPMQEDIRSNLLRRVIGGRKNASVVPTLIAFVNSNPKPESAAAALEAIRAVADETHFKDLLSILEFSNDGNIRKRCEEGIVTIIKKSSNRNTLSDSIEPAYSAATLPEVKQALMRCLGATGSPKAKEILVATLKGEDKTAKIAAADAAKNWPDDSMFETMMEILEETTDETVRPRMFHSSREFLLLESKRDEMDAEELWRMLAKNAKTDEEQEAVIRALANNPADWAMVVVEYFQDKAESDRVIDLAGKALDRMRAKARLTSKDDDEEEEEDEEKAEDEEKEEEE